MSASLEWSARTRRPDFFALRGTACVVEPDDCERARLADALRAIGYTTHETASGLVGAFIADQIHLQLVLVNVALPDGPGLKLIRDLRRKLPDVAIVAMTGDVRTGLGVALAHVAGADTVLATPASPEAISSAVSKARESEHTGPDQGRHHHA